MENNGASGGETTSQETQETTAATTTTTEQTTTETTAAVDPAPITDEVLFSEISKRYPDKIKGKEDLDRLTSFNEADYIKPKNDFVRKANEWAGDPELLVKVSKMDIEKLDNKQSIIQDMIINQGMDAKVAEIMFKKQYSAAYLDGDDLSDDEKEEKLVAEHLLSQKAVESKNNLSKWKTEAEATGNSKPQAETDAKYLQEVDQLWTKPVTKALGGLQELSIPVKYQLPDKTEVAEPFKFALDETSKKQLTELVTDFENVGPNLIKRFGKGNTAEEQTASFIEKIAILDNLDQFVQQLLEVGASKGLSNHLKQIKPGDLTQEPKAVGGNVDGKSQEDAIIEAWNKSRQTQK